MTISPTPYPRRRGRRRGGRALLVALLALPAPVRAATPAPAPQAAPPPDRRNVCVRGTCFDAELAVTAEERSRGLMFRDRLAPHEAMLFVFPREDVHRFWMKNTRIELDIIFIGADRRVISIARRATPCRVEPCEQYAPAGNAAFALEVAGGLSDRLGLAAGDLVEFGATPSRPPASGKP